MILNLENYKKIKSEMTLAKEKLQSCEDTLNSKKITLSLPEDFEGSAIIKDERDNFYIVFTRKPLDKIIKQFFKDTGEKYIHKNEPTISFNDFIHNQQVREKLETLGLFISAETDIYYPDENLLETFDINF